MDHSKATHTSTGFECEFVEQPKELPFECPVCLLVLREPHTTSCSCGNNFCRGCIERSKGSINPLCPVCNEEFETHANKWLQRALNQLSVYCTHKNKGCKWVGPLGQLDEHLNLNADTGMLIEGCGFVSLRCHDCNESMPRNTYGAHISTHCEQRPFSCDHCGEYNSNYADVINNHWPQCPCHPVECVNKCGAHPQRKDLSQHLSNECPLTSISCEDCSAQVLRGEMHKHLSFHEKLGLLDETEQEIHKLRDENQYLRGVVENLHLCTSKNEEEIRRLRLDNLEIQTEMRQQNDELIRNHEDLRKVCESLKQEYELLHASATQLSTDLAQFKLIEKESREFTSSETYSPIAAKKFPDQSGTMYYEFDTSSDLELSQASATGYPQDFEMPDLQHHPPILGPPVTVIMPNYTSYNSGRKRGEFWVSKPFYSGIQPSYQLCLSVQASRDPVSVYVRLTRGKFDDQLDWPFNADITIKLVNHGRGRDWVKTILFRNGRRVTKSKVAHGGRGIDFIALRERSSFVKDDALWFEVVDVQLT